MPTHHVAVTSPSEFWRTLAIVAIGFGMALVLSWTIDAIFPHDTHGTIAGAQAGTST